MSAADDAAIATTSVYAAAYLALLGHKAVEMGRSADGRRAKWVYSGKAAQDALIRWHGVVDAAFVEQRTKLAEYGEKSERK